MNSFLRFFSGETPRFVWQNPLLFSGKIEGMKRRRARIREAQKTMRRMQNISDIAELHDTQAAKACRIKSGQAYPKANRDRVERGMPLAGWADRAGKYEQKATEITEKDR